MSNLSRIERAAAVGKKRMDFRSSILAVAEEEFHRTNGICSRPFTHATKRAKEIAEEFLRNTPPQEHNIFRPVIRELKSLHILPMDTIEA